MLENIRQKGLFPLTVKIVDSHVESILAGEIDLTEDLERLTNKRRELVLTEMAFSTNPGVVPEEINWTKNSQLNEGALGIHVGIGEGLTGVHIDLICPGVELIN